MHDCNSTYFSSNQRIFLDTNNKSGDSFLSDRDWERFSERIWTLDSLDIYAIQCYWDMNIF